MQLGVSRLYCWHFTLIEEVATLDITIIIWMGPYIDDNVISLVLPRIQNPPSINSTDWLVTLVKTARWCLV